MQGWPQGWRYGVLNILARCSKPSNHLERAVYCNLMCIACSHILGNPPLLQIRSAMDNKYCKMGKKKCKKSYIISNIFQSLSEFALKKENMCLSISLSRDKILVWKQQIAFRSIYVLLGMEIGMGRLFNHGSSIQNIFCDCILCIEYWYFPHKTSIILSITTPENINCGIMDFIGKNNCVFFIIILSKSITFIPHLAYYLFLAWVGMGELFNHNHSPQPGPSAHLLYIVSLVIYAKYQISFHICPLFHILLIVSRYWKLAPEF